MSAETVLLGIGSNLGDRMTHLADAVRFLAGEIHVQAVAGVYETAPEGGAEQPPYLNTVVRASTALEPREVLGLARRAEGRGGRTRPYAGAPRTVDVDVLFHGSRTVREDDLTIPHPRWKERSFVVRPLLDVAAGHRDPGSGRSVEEVWRDDAPGPRPIREVAPAGWVDPSASATSETAR